ncbi:energy-coupling factor ABC transporter ATP-binding protein, partial [Paenibacillus turpanensis]|uniref:energy-coupling factor ABC transporter ATP-binding protein n=1 Tax=Paenibacillus turpanensis TaxID=2689078 RepID=UPI00140A4194
MPIKVSGISVSGTAYQGKNRLDDVSCMLCEGEITLVIGRSGAGKSTLLDVLGGLELPQSGEVVVDGTPLHKGNRLNPKVLHGVSMVFQAPEQQLFAATVQGEFDYSLRYLKLPREEAERRTDAALERFGLPREVKGRSPLTLSGGEKRRVALATVWATQPRWLLLDEPTAALDPHAAQELAQALLAWKRELPGGVVVATHDAELLLPVADRVLLLREGRLAASATPAELGGRPELWAAAGVEPPAQVRLAAQLRAMGV